MEIHNLQLYNADNLEIMANLPDESIDVVCIDPPYLYLKNQKLERPFDEQRFFAECKRLLTKKGFIVMFGRGTSFYRWNTMLDGLGFVFKEEVIWDKLYTSSPLLPLSRIHENIVLFTKKNGVINKRKVPYIEMKRYDINSIIEDVKKLKTTFKNTKSLNSVIEFLENNKVPIDIPNRTERYDSDTFTKYNTIATQDKQKGDRCVDLMQSIQFGLNEKSIIRTDRDKERTANFDVVASKETKDSDRCVNVMQSIQFGLNEKSIIRTDKGAEFKKGVSITKGGNQLDRCVNVIQGIGFGLNEKTIIKQSRDHYKTIHPTQKPVRLLERLLALVIPKDKPREEVVVADFFAGSMSCMEAVHNMGMKGIATEIDQEYFEKGKQRIMQLQPKLLNEA
jgi:DNA (cytosine-5-)-methyltransferase|nr:MAG TPA: adenine-specific methyltransferase [Caudoviricetes sp.]